MYQINQIKKENGKLPLTTDGSLRVVFIGVGAAFTKRLRQSNILLIQNGHHVLIDCGTQGPLALNDLGLDVLDIRCHLPTHSHADHIGGLEEVMLTNRYSSDKPPPEMIILRDYQEILWGKSLSGGAEYCESNGGRPLQLGDFFQIRRPHADQVLGRKVWIYQHGPIELMMIRSRHYPNTATSVDESQWCVGILVNRRVWISGDTMFDLPYLERFQDLAEVLFHDCQLYQGGVHASYRELMSLPGKTREKLFLYHYGDQWDQPAKWVLPDDRFTGNPVDDGFLGWAEQQVAYDFF